MNKILPVILCGGSGLRLWPFSRKSKPKQFLRIPFQEKQSIFQKTVLDFSLNHFLKPIVIGSEINKFLIRDQLIEINKPLKNIIVENESRNTAASVCIAAIKSLKEYNDAPILVSPSDQLFKDRKKFFDQDFFKNISQISFNIIFGLKPSRASTSMGYIKVEKKINKELQKVEKFFEKPNLNKAKLFSQDKKFFWNSGMFLLKPSLIISEFKNVDNQFYINCLNSYEKLENDLGFEVLNKYYFIKNNNISFDKLILEKSKNIFMKKITSAWSDLGSWDSLWEKEKKDKNGNYIQGNIKQKDIKNSIIISNKECNIISNIEDMVVVNVDNALLVSKKNNFDFLKNSLQSETARSYTYGHVEYRPWGDFKIIEKDQSFIVKKLTINSGCRISLQLHNFRSEHWTVVTGQAKVTLGDKIIILKKNESIYIPKKTRHCIENTTNQKVEIIETQIGEKISEDDIIRFEDPYNRKV